MDTTPPAPSVITLQLTGGGPIYGDPTWSCSVSGLTEAVLKWFQSNKPSLTVNWYRFKTPRTGVSVKLYNILWEVDLTGWDVSIHNEVIPVDVVNDALNLLASYGYRIVSCTSAVTTDSKGCVDQKSFVWTLQN